MNREVLINIINRGRIRFIPVRRCFLCNEYVGYKFVRMCDGSMIPVFSSGCRCCGINNGTLSERTWDEVLDLVKTVQNKPMNERTEEDEFILNSLGDYTGISNEEAQEVDDFVKHADGCPVGVDWGTEGFYSYNDANAIGGTCVDVIFSKYNQ